MIAVTHSPLPIITTPSYVAPTLQCSRTEIIAAWIQSVEQHNVSLPPTPPSPLSRPETASRKSTSNSQKNRESAFSSPHRRALITLDSNMSRRPPQTPSPRKSARLQGRKEEKRIQTDDLGSPEKTPRPIIGRVTTLPLGIPNPGIGSPTRQSSSNKLAKPDDRPRFEPDGYTQALYNSVSGLNQDSAPPSPTKSTTTTSTTTSKSRRSKSPVKRTADLLLSLKPISQKTLSSLAALPPGVRPLFTSIKGIASGKDVIPRMVETRIQKRLRITDDELLPHNLYELDDLPAQSQRRRPRTIYAARRELSVLHKVAQKTGQWIIENVSEASWNSLVHTPLLEIAIDPPSEADDDESDVDVDNDADADGDAPVSFWDITAARPHRSFLPKDARGEALEAKMVDFCLSVSDSDIQAAAVRTVKACQANARPGDGTLIRSINHTEYMPLRWRPIAVNIETKTPDGSSQEGMAQLSVWAATHFERLRALTRSKTALFGEMQKEEALSMALPLLLIQGSTWSLFFAVDRTDRIDILNAIAIGNTTTLIGCYKVMAALRELAAWSETTFRTWLLDEVLI